MFIILLKNAKNEEFFLELSIFNICAIYYRTFYRTR